MVGAVGVLCRNEGQLLGVDLRLRDHLFSVTSLLFSRSAAAVSRLVILMLARLSPSMSLKLKSAAAKGVVVSSLVIDCRAGCAGASLTGSTVIEAVSIAVG